MPKIINITDKDFRDIANEVTAHYIEDGVFIDPEELVRNMRNKSPEQRYNEFARLIELYPRAWEFVPFYKDDSYPEEVENKRFRDMVDNILPVDIRNSGDPVAIESYLQNTPNISMRGKAILIKRLRALDKIELNNQTAQARENGQEPFNNRPKLTVSNNGNRFVLDVDMTEPQSSGFGCWSCSGKMLLKGRGVHNVTQEDIRAFRPKYPTNQLMGPKFQTNVTIDRAFNSDNMQNVMDMGDALINFAPDSMLRTLDILRMKEAELTIGRQFTPQEKEAYKRNAINLIKKTIRKAIMVDKSPVTITNGGHYITILGMDGDDILFKSSTGDNVNVRYKKPLNQMVHNLLYGKYKLQFIWMNDIQLAQDHKTFYNVPSSTLSLKEDGTLQMPPDILQYDANSMKAEQELDGFRMRLYAGKETTASDRIGTNIMVDGVIKMEQCYFPKKVNAKRLKAMADSRKPEEEARLKNETIELLGYDPVEAKKAKKTSRDLDSVRMAPSLEHLDTKSKFKTDDDFENELDRKTRMSNKNQRFFDRKFVDINERKKEKSEHIENRFANVAVSIGKNNPFYTPEKDSNGKTYIWNNEGAVTAFRLQLAYGAIIPVLERLGKLEKAAELKKRYDELMNKLKTPENAITPEEGATLSGWNGNGVSLPNGQINMTHYFKNKEDIYEATMLLESIKASVSITADLKLKRPNDKDYKPSILSSCMEHIDSICDYTNGNILKACGKSPYVYNAIKKSTTLPNYELDQLNVPLNNAGPNIQNYIFHIRMLFQSLSNEYKTQQLDNEVGFVNPYNIRPITDSYSKTGRTIIGSYNKLVKLDPSQKDNDLEPSLAFMNGEAKALANGWMLSEKNILGFIIAIDAEIYVCEQTGVQVNQDMKREFEALFNSVRSLKVDESKYVNKQQIAQALYSLCTKYISEPGMKFVRDNRMLLDEVCKQFIELKDFDLSKADDIKIVKDDNTDEIKIEIDEPKVEDEPKKDDEPKVEDEPKKEDEPKATGEPKKDDEKIDEEKNDEPEKEEEKKEVDPEAIRKLEEAFASLNMTNQEIKANEEKPIETLFSDEEIMGDEELLKEFDEELKAYDEEMTLDEFLATLNARKQNEEEKEDKEEEINPDELPPYKRYDDYDTVLRENIMSNCNQAILSFGNSISYGENEMYSMTKDFRELTFTDPEGLLGQTYGLPLASDRYGDFKRADNTKAELYPVVDRNAFKRYKKKLEGAASDMEELIDSKFENGEIGSDAAIYSKVFTSNAIRRTLRGYGYDYISSKTPLGLGIVGLDSSLNPVVNEGLDDKIKKWRDKFPVHDLIIEGGNQLDHLADYWSLKEQGKMTPEIEKLYRETLYSESVRMQEMINRMEASIEDPATNAEIKNDNVMSVDSTPDCIHSGAARGMRILSASVDAYKTGLENGWTIDDIGILAGFNLIRMTSIVQANFDPTNPDKLQRRDKPLFINDDHKAFVEKMDSFYKKIKKTPIKNAETRKKIINQIQKMLDEAKEKNYLPRDEKQMSYVNQMIDNVRKRDVLIEAGAEKAFHDDEIAKSIDRDREIELFLVDFNKPRTDLYIGKESEEHKNLREAVEKVNRVRENIYAPGADDNLDSADVELYFNALDEAIYNSKVYQKEKKNPGTEAGKDRLKGSIKIEKLFKEERNRLLGFAKDGLLLNFTDSIEEYRLRLAEEKCADAYNTMLRIPKMPTTDNEKTRFMGLAAEIMVYKFASSESEANKKAFNAMGINNLKKEIMNDSDFKSLMKNYFRDRQMTPDRLARELDGNEALLRMRDMSSKFQTANTKKKQRVEKVEEKLKNNKIQM